MASCFVPLCKPFEGGPKSSFFSTPKDEKLFSEWKRAIPKRVDNVELSHSSKICHKHFRQDDILRFDLVPCNNGDIVSVPRARVKLREDAVPSIFPASITYSQIDQVVMQEKIPETELITCDVEISRVSAFISNLILPSDSWLAKPCPDSTEKAVIFKFRVSADGWPLVGNSVQINLEDNSIFYRVESVRPLPAGILPTHFNSPQNLEEILTHYDDLRMCPGVIDPVFHKIPIHSVPTGRLENGIWRSLTCSELSPQFLSYSSVLCESCYQLKRNILKRRIKEEDGNRKVQQSLKEKAESLTKENKLLKNTIWRRDQRLKVLEEETKKLRQEMDSRENSATNSNDKKKRKKADN